MSKKKKVRSFEHRKQKSLKLTVVSVVYCLRIPFLAEWSTCCLQDICRKELNISEGLWIDLMRHFMLFSFLFVLLPTYASDENGKITCSSVTPPSRVFISISKEVLFLLTLCGAIVRFRSISTWGVIFCRRFLYLFGLKILGKIRK